MVTFIDMGTNSIRVLVVRLNPNHSYTILTRQKQQVRLGEGEFEDEEITPAGNGPGRHGGKKFTDLARTFRSEEFVAVATSATREASNQNELLHRIRQEAQLDVRVISGREEARLIYLGVASGTHIGNRKVFFIDIGGGSTEIALGDARNYHYLDSFRLGAIRLSNLYAGTGWERCRLAGTVQKDPAACTGCNHPFHGNDPEVRARLHHREFRHGDEPCRDRGEGPAFLQRVFGRRIRPDPEYKDLKKVIDLLCPLPLEQRRKVPGMNPNGPTSSSPAPRSSRRS